MEHCRAGEEMTELELKQISYGRGWSRTEDPGAGVEARCRAGAELNTVK